MRLRPPEELVALGFSRSPVVLLSTENGLE